MQSPVVRLKLRVRLPDGTRQYLDPVFTGNHKLRPGFANYNGFPTHFADGVYHLRYQRGGKRVWEGVGKDAQAALNAQTKRERAMGAVAAGVQLAEVQTIEKPKRPLTDCIRIYLAEIKEHRQRKTCAAYTKSLLSFAATKLGVPDLTLESLSGLTAKAYIEDLTREDALAWIAALRQRGNQPRTLFNRANNLNIFVRHFGFAGLLTKKDKPRFTQKQVRAYNALELGKMFGYASEDEADLLYFLLCTGAREQDASYACWADVDLVSKTYTVTEHLDLGYRPKDKEEGTLPLPDILVERLQKRRRRHPRTRLIFEAASGKPERHMLRIVKSLALRAGVNCCECVNKKGQSCIAYPVCRHIILHKMRKTFATSVHNAGMPAKTVQRYLRHSDLTSTLRYLADQPDEQVRATINGTFGAFAAERVNNRASTPDVKHMEVA